MFLYRKGRSICNISKNDARRCSLFFENTQTNRLTSLAVVLCPTPSPEVSVNGVLRADGLALCCAGTHISTLLFILIGHDVVVLHRVQDLRPVQSGQVAEVWVLLNPHGAAGDVHEAVEAQVLQLQHLEQHQGVVEEEIVATDHGQVGEKLAEALQAVDPEQQQVVGDHPQLGEAEAAEVLGLGLEHEQDLQVALDDGAILQRLEVGHIVSDVLTLADWRDGEEEDGEKDKR